MVPAFIFSIGIAYEADLYPPDIRLIRERGQLIVSQYRGERSIFFMYDDDRKHPDLSDYITPEGRRLVGIDIENANRLAELLDVELIVRKTAASFDEVCLQVARGEADIGLSKLSITGKRAQLVRFSEPYAVFRMALLINRQNQSRLFGNRSIKSGNVLNRFNDSAIRIGVIEGTSWAEHALQLFSSSTIVGFETLDQAFNELYRGGLTAVFDSEFNVQFKLFVNPEFGVYCYPLNIGSKLDYLAMAVSPQSPNLLAVINAMLRYEDMKTDAIQVIKGFFPNYEIISAKDRDIDNQTQKEESLALKGKPLSLTVLLSLLVSLLYFQLMFWLKRKPETLPLIDETTVKAPSPPDSGEEAQREESRWEILKQPWLSFVAIASGIIAGIFFGSFALRISFIGDIYLALLNMSILPIVSTSLILSMSDMVRGGNTGSRILRLLMAYAATGLTVVIFTVTLWIIVEPLITVSLETRQYLGNMFLSTNVNLPQQGEAGFIGLIKSVFPDNIVNAYSEGMMLPILFISIITGIVLGLLDRKSVQPMTSLCSSLLEVFSKVLDITLYMLPIGLFSLFASIIAELGVDALGALSGLIMFYMFILLVAIIYNLEIIRRRTGTTFGHVLRALKEPMIVSLITDSTTAILPAYEAMEDKLNQSPEICNFAIPVSVQVNAQSYPTLFAVIALFAANLYSLPLDITGYIVIIVLAIMAGTPATGSYISMGMMVMYILYPLGLPVNAGVFIFLIVIPVIEQPLEVLNLLSSCANATLIADCHAEDA